MKEGKNCRANNQEGQIIHNTPELLFENKKVAKGETTSTWMVWLNTIEKWHF